MQFQPTATELARLHKLPPGETMAFVRPVVPQPPSACHYSMNGAGTHALCLADEPPGGQLIWFSSFR